MVDPAQPTEPETVAEPPPPEPALPAAAPIEPAPIEPAPIEPPPPPAWTRAYELPTARRVVSAGLQLALSSSRQIRRASLLIGLLGLGAIGPAIVVLLVGIGRLVNDPATAEQFAADPFTLLATQPGIGEPFLIVYALLAIGFLLLLVIGVDAQAVAIAMLAGTASDRPVRLFEAVIRARQVFGRLAGANFLVGITAALIAFVIQLPFQRPFAPNEGISFVAQMIGLLCVAPWAYAATAVVLGDVPAVEALKRSKALYGARKWTALVVTLFTLVTSAIQTFAISAGLEVAVGVADTLHLGLDQGLVSSVLLGGAVLGFVVAFGSLTFTIAAIVAAPQVAAFLGLTFHTGGIDRARVEGDRPPPGFRWLTRKMLALMIGLVLLGVIGLQSIADFQPI